MLLFSVFFVPKPKAVELRGWARRLVEPEPGGANGGLAVLPAAQSAPLQRARSKETVQRLGRWASDAFAGYIWEDSELTLGLSTRMLRAPWSPHMGAF